MKEIYLIGIQTSFISEAIEICELNGFNKIILIDNLNKIPRKKIDGYSVYGLNNFLNRKNTINFCCCLHTPIFREKVINSLPVNYKGYSIVHPKAVISKRARISNRGVIIGANSVIGAHSDISDYVIINRGTLIGHDVVIGSFSTIESGAILGGKTNIGKKSFVGMGAKILPEITIGNNSVVGAGAVVRNDVKGGSLVAGIPAVVKKTNIEGYIGTG